MDLKPLFYTIFKTLNPYSYDELTDRRLSYALKYFAFITIFCIILMFILFIPFLFYTHQYVAEDIAHFQNLTVASTFTLKDSFNLLSDPIIKFDSKKQNISDEFVLITPDTASYRQFFMFGKQIDIPLNKGLDIASSPNANVFISLGLLFLLPSLFFWSIIFFMVYFMMIIFVTFILGSILAGIFRVNITLLKTLKASIYACTIFIVLQLVLMPFFRLLLLPLALYWILFLIILFLWRDEEDERERRGQDREGSSKNKDMFGRKDKPKDSWWPDKRNIVQDAYDVDEHGNLKSGSKKHHNEDDEDGYVRL